MQRRPADDCPTDRSMDAPAQNLQQRLFDVDLSGHVTQIVPRTIASLAHTAVVNDSIAPRVAATTSASPASSGYQTKQEHIAVAGVDDLLIRSLLDKEQFSDPYGDAERLGISSAMWPLFGLLWPSGAELAARMGNRLITPGERVLEIGCGLALASLVAHRRGVDVTASDCHPLAAKFLSANLLLNGLLPMPYRHGHWSSLLLPIGRDNVAASTVVSGRYDLIIGSDVLYERDADARLPAFIALHSTDRAEVWIVDPDRGNRSAFSRQMAAMGFAVREERLARLPSKSAAHYKGRLLVYART